MARAWRLKESLIYIIIDRLYRIQENSNEAMVSVDKFNRSARFRCDLAAFIKGRIHKRPHIKGRRSKRPHAKKAAGQKGRSSKKTTITEIM